MTTTAPAPASGRPGTRAPAADLLAAVREIQPLLRENSAANEAAGRLTDEVVEALHARGLFGMWVPEVLGGAELDPLASLEVIQALAEADPSTAWVTMAAAVATGSGGAYLPDAAVAAMFGGDRFPVVAGQGTRPGRAVPEGDGYRLSGSWGFASGIRHAQWIHTLGTVEGTGEPRIFVLPVDQAQLIENWDVMGLRATGSLDYSIDDLYVPAEFTHVGPTEIPERGGPLFRLGIIQLALIAHSAWGLGVARRMLDDLAELVRAKAGRPGTLADSSTFQATYAEAEARWHSARAFVHESWRAATDTVYAGGSLSHEQKTLLRLALHNATWAAEEISAAVYRVAGTTALRSGPLQQYYRDMHAGTQHVTSGPGVLEACGRSLAGLAPGTDWLYLALVPAG